MAIGKKAPKMVDFLLQPENKADLTVKNSIGRTALHYACSATGWFVTLIFRIKYMYSQQYEVISLLCVSVYA